MEQKSFNGYYHLSNDRYNAQDRALISSSITARFKNLQCLVQKRGRHSSMYTLSFFVARGVYDLLDDRLEREVELYQSIFTIMNALMIYASNVRYSNIVGGLLHITIVKIGEDTEMQHVSVPALVLNSVIYHNLIFDAGKLEDVLSDVRMKITRDVELLPQRNGATDGQMKIMVDAILAVDALENKDSQKVMVIGSGHEPLAHPRYAYAPMMQMLQHSEISLYDYVEEKGVTKEGTNIVTRYSEPAPLEKMKTQDLVLDDVWANNRTTIQSDYMRNKEIQDQYPENFSVKSFMYRLDEANVYYQCAYTRASEVRLVTRPIIPVYRNNKMLGSCVYCRELKFFLKNDYPISFYLAVLMTHQKPCRVPELNLMTQYLHKKHSRVEHVEWEPIIGKGFHTSLEIEERLKLGMREVTVRESKWRRLVNDQGLYLPPVEMRPELLTLVDVVVSDDHYVTMTLFEKAANIFKLTGRELYMLKRDRKGVVMDDSEEVKTQMHRGYNK